MGFSAFNERLALEDEYFLYVSMVLRRLGFLPESLKPQLTVDSVKGVNSSDLRDRVDTLKLVIELR